MARWRLRRGAAFPAHHRFDQKIDRQDGAERTHFQDYGLEEDQFGLLQDIMTPTSARAVALYKPRKPAPRSPPGLRTRPA
jgi:hypothetical protein